MSRRPSSKDTGSPETLGRYTLLRPLAQGGMGDVYLAEVTGAAGFTRPAVIKRIRPELAGRGDAVGMFIDEARLCAQLQHPNVVQVFDLGETEDGFFMAMEFVDGVHVGKLLTVTATQGTPLAPEICAYVGARVAEALHYAHHARNLTTGEPLRVVHRDVSPSNILLSRTGEVKLTDFGVAKAKTQQVKTAMGYVKGKVAYLSPEQVDLKPIDGRSDVFALGVVMWELLARMRLYKESDEFIAMERILREPAPPITAYNKAAPPDLEAVVLRALEKAPGDRYATAGALQDALEGWLRTHGHFHPQRALAQAITDHEELLGLHIDTDANTEVIHARSASLPTSGGGAADASVSKPVALPRPPLPRFDGAFVGRSSEIEALHRHFLDGARIVALAGPPGIGKTRLAVEYAQRVLDPAPGGDRWPASGVAFCDLAGALDDEERMLRLAAAIGVRVAPHGSADEAAAGLRTALATAGPTLVVLDGLDAETSVAPLLATFRSLADEVRMLVTTTRPEALFESPAEGVVVDLSPLRHQDPAEGGGFDAVALFVQRVRSVRPDYAPSDADVATVQRIVARLGGNPLAIEIAAGQVVGADVASLLGTYDAVGDSGSDDGAERDPDEGDWSENSVTFALRHGLDRVPRVEQEALAQVAMFPGRLSADSAGAIINLSEVDETVSVDAVLDRLVQRGLLRRVTVERDTRQLTMLELQDSVRSRAAELLEAHPARLAIAARFDAVQLERGERAAAAVDGPTGLAALSMLEHEQPNLLAVLDRACQQEPPHVDDAVIAARAALCLSAHYRTRGPAAHHLRVLGRAIETAKRALTELRSGVSAPSPSDGAVTERRQELARLAVQLLLRRGEALLRRGTPAEARDDLQRAETNAARQGLRALEAEAALLQAHVDAEVDGPAASEAALQRALTLARAAGDASLEGRTLAADATRRLALGERQDAEELLGRAIALLEATGDGRRLSEAKRQLAELVRIRDRDRAIALAREAADLAAEVGDRAAGSDAWSWLADRALEDLDDDEATRRAEQAFVLARAAGDQRAEALALGALGAAIAGRGRPDEAEGHLEEAAAVLLRAGLKRLVRVIEVRQGHVELARGQPDAARQRLDAGSDVPEVRAAVELLARRITARR